ncbi:uncharacterized protein RCC_07619 [Ramularia collo-cygni]|uniref:AMP-activated protein kinase glycogen-binding domain-containing protein n=1 Tax=Ramularia collo-cygni TaxID=112498 RepID=A0A2D3VFT6_9PEZI|nr:uncharacterized protein RCC_07619 [Ramularia collo-cygni]CZT21754.1 uncharacterized protein RCC_07619 [Ramularia collo-cygni]
MAEVDDLSDVFGENSFTNAIPRPGTARVAKERMRSQRIPGSVPWPTSMNDTILRNVEAALPQARPFQEEILEKLNINSGNSIVAAGDENVLIRTPSDNGASLAVIIHMLLTIKPIVDTLPPITGRMVHPTLAIAVTDTWEAADRLFAWARDFLSGTNIFVGLWHGKSDRSRDGPGDIDAQHILITTAGMFKTKFQRQELDTRQLRIVAILNGDRVLGDEGHQIPSLHRGGEFSTSGGIIALDCKHDDHVKDGILAAVNQARDKNLDVQVIVKVSHGSPSQKVEEELRALMGLEDTAAPRELVGGSRTVNNRQTFIKYTSHSPKEGSTKELNALLDRICTYIKETFFTGDAEKDENPGRCLIAVSRVHMVDTIHSALTKFLQQGDGVTEEDATSMVGKWHSGTIDSDAAAAGLQWRGGSGLDKFNDPTSNMLFLVATPAIGSINLPTATKILIAKVPDSIHGSDKAARTMMLDATIGRDGVPCDVTILVDNRWDRNVIEEMEALYKEHEVIPPSSLQRGPHQQLARMPRKAPPPNTKADREVVNKKKALDKAKDVTPPSSLQQAPHRKLSRKSREAPPPDTEADREVINEKKALDKAKDVTPPSSSRMATLLDGNWGLQKPPQQQIVLASRELPPTDPADIPSSPPESVGPSTLQANRNVIATIPEVIAETVHGGVEDFIRTTDVAGVPFTVSIVSTEKLYLAGNFLNAGQAWEPVLMEQEFGDTAGETKSTKALVEPPGTYQFKFVTEGGVWFVNPSEPVVVDDVGNENNQVVVSVKDEYMMSGGLGEQV